MEGSPASLKARIGAIAEEIAPDLIELRRTIHRHPELAFEEHRTAALVAERLRRLGIAPRTGVGRTGLVGLIEGARPGPTIGIRADMDALPVTEATGLPFASEIPGKMHACGHDVHTVIALGAAEVLSRLRQSLPGRVKLIFQPAEETLMGAPAMIADGVLENPKMDAILGYHNWPPVAAGSIGYHPTMVMASSDAFDLELTGRGGHAAHPHNAIDTLAGAAHIVTLLQTIVSREIAPIVPAVLTIGEIHGGTARNVIAETVTMKGSVRTLDKAARDQVEAAMRRILDGACQSLRLSYKLDWTSLAPVLRNDAAILASVLGSARDILGPDKVIELPSPSMGSEDFAWFSDRVPAAHLRIGSKIEGLTTSIHASNYDCNDLAIPTGVRAIAYAAVRLLETLPAPRA